MVQVAPWTGETAARPRTTRARRVLLLAWVFCVVTPYALQIRGFLRFVVRHQIPRSLLPTADARIVTNATEVVVHCPVTGLYVSESQFFAYPSHYYDDEAGDVLCHYLIPDYDGHGMYKIHHHDHKTASVPTTCTIDSVAIEYYAYKGNLGYVALYEQGEGSFCSANGVASVVASAVGSNDLNFNALSTFTGSTGYCFSYYFAVIGSSWLVFRALVLTRSLVLWSQFGRQLDAVNEPLSVSDAVVFIQQAARLVPHTVTNWHRLGVIYLLLEGLMTDLFFLSVLSGYSRKIQYISLGYNVAGFLSMLFELLEHSSLLKPSTRLLLRRLLFNTEVMIWGELCSAVAMFYILAALNWTPDSTSDVVKAESHYVWSVYNHCMLLLYQALCILSARLVGTLVFVRWRYGSLRVLTTSCCVDSAMDVRCKLVKIAGYEVHDQRLYYNKETLKAHGLLKTADEKGVEYLVYHKIRWLPCRRQELTIVGKLSGEHVDSSPEQPYYGPVVVCDRMLGAN